MYIAEKLQELCQIEANLSELCTEKSKKSVVGVLSYWLLDFEIEIKMGTTEIEARIKWEEDVRWFSYLASPRYGLGLIYFIFTLMPG